MNNFVSFGGIICNVTSSHATTIQCTLGSGLGGTDKKLWVHVLPEGIADTNNITLSYSITVDTVSPSAIGLGGGIEAIIEGSGFAIDSTTTTDTSGIAYTYYQEVMSSLEECNVWDTRVYFDTVQSTILSITPTSIHCIIPSTHSSGSPTVRIAVICTDEGSSEAYERSATGVFEYDDDLSVTVDDIDPPQGPGSGGTLVTIEGSGYTNDTIVQVIWYL